MSDLSPQEIRVACSYVAGGSARQVAARLRLTPESVKAYVKRVRAKYRARGWDVADKTQLLLRLVDEGHLTLATVPRLDLRGSEPKRGNR